MSNSYFFRHIKKRKTVSNTNNKSSKLFSGHLLIIICILSITCISGCSAKHTCDYCNEEKYCKEYTILDKTRFICDDCLNKELDPTTGKPILDYTSDLLDLSVYGIVSEDSATEEELSDEELDNDESDNSPSLEEILATPPQNTVTESQTNSSDLSSIISKVTSSLSSSGYELSQNEDETYKLTSDSNDTGIVFSFSTTSSGKPSLIISVNNTNNENTFIHACIGSALAFLDSNDFEGLGYDIYNNANQYGNYTVNNHGFYYFDGSVDGADKNIVHSFQIAAK